MKTKKTYTHEVPVTIIIMAYNAKKVIRDAIESLIMQHYPIAGIIVIDNCSTDATVAEVATIKKLHKSFPIRLISQKINQGLSASYNLGATLARTDYVITMHADGLLPTNGELRKLMTPVLQDKNVIAAGPQLLHPKKLWNNYPFWQKLLFARVVGKVTPSGNGKFDCLRRDTFLKLGGYDEESFPSSIGSEDADMYVRLESAGLVINTAAQVVHNHPVEQGYTLLSVARRQKYYSIAYGRYLQLNLNSLRLKSLVFFIKPIIAFLSFLTFYHIVFLLPLLLFPFFYVPIMFTDPMTRRDRNIVLLPFVLYFLVYYESFWMLTSLLFFRSKR
ncbi:MAG: glycosyltransferase family A protein [Patescibacteria group bacterium]